MNITNEELINALVEGLLDISNRLSDYRAKNVNKYHREMDLEFSEYTKAERYKNRVRLVDCVLPAINSVLLVCNLHHHEETQQHHYVAQEPTNLASNQLMPEID